MILQCSFAEEEEGKGREGVIKACLEESIGGIMGALLFSVWHLLYGFSQTRNWCWVSKGAIVWEQQTQLLIKFLFFTRGGLGIIVFGS
jgi:hypothetical protein